MAHDGSVSADVPFKWSQASRASRGKVVETTWNRLLLGNEDFGCFLLISLEQIAGDVGGTNKGNETCTYNCIKRY